MLTCQSHACKRRVKWVVNIASHTYLHVMLVLFALDFSYFDRLLVEEIEPKHFPNIFP